jgi:vacuolar-type H+-ATPase subunit C/Vma6
MTAVARRAYGQARARARSATICSELAVLAVAAAPVLTRLPGWRDLEPADDGSATLALAYSRLVDDHLVMRHAYPEARGALAALLQLHELENLKLLWRAAVRGTALADWRGSWRPLGLLQRIALEWFADTLTLVSLAGALKGTPYRELAEATMQAHGEDVGAAELAIDRFGARTLAAAHDRLPEAERSARTLLRAVIDRRDALIGERARTALGLSAAAAALMAPSVLPGRPGRTLRGRTDARPRVTVMARRILALEPFSLAVPLALVLMREEEVRQLVTLSEVRARHLTAVEARRAMEAASQGR